MRNILGLAADIGYRAAVLNPHLQRDASKLTPGIVLIDEIDLHLHPKGQRRVTDDLRRTFPNMQFIAGTHSPFIIQSLRQGELIDLAKGPTGEYANRSIEDMRSRKRRSSTRWCSHSPTSTPIPTPGATMASETSVSGS